MSAPQLSVIVPAYNEEMGLAETHRRLTGVLSGMDVDYEIIYIDDGSRDRTLEIVESLRASDDHVRLLSLARNHGHQIAVTAGLDAAEGDAVVIIDADLQDPPEVIPRMYERFLEGYDVVYGKRSGREGDSAFKKGTAFAFYRLLNALTDVEIPADTGDFRLVSRRAADAVRGMREHDRYLRGMFAWIGFKQTPVEFDRDKRFAGETHYPLRRMLKLAIDGVMSFSVKPLGAIAALGAIMAGAGLLWLIILLTLLLAGSKGLGLSAIAAMMLECSGLILTALGIVGGYVGRVYQEVQNRPLYRLARREGFNDR
ncbi:MAG: glycosyltransferase family 2 protein [Oscillospiraceae bacterium]|jgi:dolichol-phosphate mannosyltransferase|nr:glycosyltransferase family 2 protein [Oscillospiraceae bacterium]